MGVIDLVTPYKLEEMIGMTLVFNLTDDNLDKISGHNAKTFYDLKKDLVMSRMKSYSLDEVAELLGESLEDAAELEQYYSDPTLTQLRNYALAIKAYIVIRAEEYAGGNDDTIMDVEPTGDVDDYNKNSLKRMMNDLVQARVRQCTREELAELLKSSEQEITEVFESDDSDPTVSQVQEYALALGMTIDTRVVSL